jgi:hypothetical protein
MRRRWIVAFALAIGAAIIAPLAVWALIPSGTYNGNLDRQQAKWRATALTTTSVGWANVPVLSVNICAINEVSATLSVNVSGGRVRFRMVGEQGNVIKPGMAEFAPTGTVDSFSYTFVTSVGTFEADDRHTLRVQWRSVSGASVTLRRADLNVLYERGSLC